MGGAVIEEFMIPIISDTYRCEQVNGDQVFPTH